MGRALGNAMLNLEVESSTSDALGKLGLELEEIIDQEHDAGLGNGGLDGWLPVFWIVVPLCSYL